MNPRQATPAAEGTPQPPAGVACADDSRRRWLVAAAGFLFMASVGTMYAWSVFRNPLREAHGWSGPETGLAFSLLLLVNGLTTAFFGRWSDSARGRRIAVIAALAFGGGTLIAGLADTCSSRLLLWLGYGVCCGIGSGLGYINTLTLLVRWFPDRAALVTGGAVMSAGLGAAAMGRFAPPLIIAAGPGTAFYVLGVIFTLLLLACARRLRNPPGHWSACPQAAPRPGATAPVAPGEAFRTFNFYILWLLVFINVTAGTGLLSALSPLAQARAGMDALAAGRLIFYGSLCNGAGRLAWAFFSERAGRRRTFVIIFALMALALGALPPLAAAAPLTFFACLALFCYGGAFGTMPAFVTDTFGAASFGAIYGRILLAFGIGGVAGPMLMETIEARTGSFAPALGILAGLAAAAITLLLAWRPAGGKRAGK